MWQRASSLESVTHLLRKDEFGDTGGRSTAAFDGCELEL